MNKIEVTAMGVSEDELEIINDALLCYAFFADLIANNSRDDNMPLSMAMRVRYDDIAALLDKIASARQIS